MNNFVTVKKLQINSVVSVAMLFCSLAISFWLIPVFIRNLGAELYGVWLISGIVSGQLGFLDLGFTSGLVRQIAIELAENNMRKASQCVWAGLVLLAGIGLLTGSVVIAGRGIIVHWFQIATPQQPIALSLLLATGCCMLVEWPLRIMDVLPQAAMLDRYTVPVTMLNTILLNAVMIVCLQSGFHSLALLRIIQGGSKVVVAGIQILIARRFIPDFRFQKFESPWKILKGIMPYSLGMFYASVLRYVAIGIDSFILGIALGPVAIAVYNIVCKPFTIIQQITAKVLAGFETAVVHIDTEGDHGRLERLLNKSISFRIWVVFSMVFATIIVMPAFLRLWVGDMFVPYTFWGQFYLIVPLFACLGQAVGVLRGCGKLKFVNTIFTLSSLFNFVVSLILVRFWGVGGVIAGTVASHLLLGDPMCFPFICRQMNFPPRPGYTMLGHTLLCDLLLGIPLYLVLQPLLTSWLMLLAAACVCGVLFLSLNWFTALLPELRKMLLQQLSSMIHRKIA